jgi:hypothetical protein
MGFEQREDVVGGEQPAIARQLGEVSAVDACALWLEPLPEPRQAHGVKAPVLDLPGVLGSEALIGRVVGGSLSRQLEPVDDDHAAGWVLDPAAVRA